MSYKCPKCGDLVHRGFKHSTTAQFTGGLFGALIYACGSAAFGNFTCNRCGEILRSSFADADRRKMLLGSLALIAVAVVVLIGGIVLFVALNK